MSDIIEVEDKEEEYEDICYICRRPESIAGSMIKIPGNICICRDCMQKTIDTMQNSGFNYDSLLGMNNNINSILGNKNAQAPAKKAEESSEEPEEEEKETSSPNPLPNISMINLADLQSLMPTTRQKIKKKKKDKSKPLSDIKDIPKPHVIKEKLDEYVVG